MLTECAFTAPVNLCMERSGSRWAKFISITPSGRFRKLKHRVQEHSNVCATDYPIIINNTQKSAFLRLCVLRSSYFAHEILTRRLLINYRWFDAVRWRSYRVHAVVAPDFSRLETNRPTIRAWFQTELYHLRVLEPKYRKLTYSQRFPEEVVWESGKPPPRTLPAPQGPYGSIAPHTASLLTFRTTEW